jgi:hypothetical protein
MNPRNQKLLTAILVLAFAGLSLLIVAALEWLWILRP